MLYQSVIKPVLDRFIALLGILVLSPIFLFMTIILLIANKGKPFFIQARPGKNEKIFYLIKFKTMNDEKDINGNILSDEKRITKTGSFIRKKSLDEIPQFINVLIGDLSFVGPRPLLIEYLPLYNEFQRRRHKVKPGITGWAQINGRNTISWEEKFKLDVWYVDHLSFVLDLKIVFLTIIKVFKQEGISEVGHATTEAFNGKN